MIGGIVQYWFIFIALNQGIMSQMWVRVEHHFFNMLGARVSLDLWFDEPLGVIVSRLAIT